MEWLASNYYRTALELGHCLRLPEEGLCECDRFLTCSNFLTTTEYAPRLRERLCLEERLARDAAERGWPREVEPHAATAGRIADLLNEFSEPVASDASVAPPINDSGAHRRQGPGSVT